MLKYTTSIVILLFMLTSGLYSYSQLRAQDEVIPPPPKNSENASIESDWPRQFTVDHQTFIIYQPEVETLKDNKLEERAAIELQTPSSGQPVFGVMWITARTEVDKSSHIVNLEDVQVTQISFPTAKGKEPSYLSILQQRVPSVLQTISLDRLDASLSVAKTESQRKVSEVKNEPPKIIYDSKPAILVLIDGDPVLRDSGAPSFLRIINTRALFLLDQTDGKYYYSIGNKWMSSSSLSGQWQLVDRPSNDLSSALKKAKQMSDDQNQVEPSNDPTTVSEIKMGTIPKIYVSTKPAELILTRGGPQFEPIPNTQILYVKNTANDLFLNTSDQHYYLLITGRWYRSPTLKGSWSYVTPNELPLEFTKISDSHPKGSVLASVSGTPQSEEAEISNSIPQTATVDRSAAKAEISYDGAAEFVPIVGTPLKYATNSPTPVIEVDVHSFYSVQNGVWFVATSPHGPWVAADNVPAVIYTIPPSSPLYYVTYVYVYGANPHSIYTGYLPGYLGSYLTPYGTVVYGTGYAYPHWIGTVWYGAPVTFGFGVAWGYGFGWSFHSGFNAGYFGGTYYRPWWGPWRWATAHGVHYGTPFGYRNLAVDQVNINHLNVYRNWGPKVVRSTWVQNRPLPGFNTSRVGVTNRPYRYSAPSRGTALNTHTMGHAHSNNVYTDQKGNIYRHRTQGTQGTQGSEGWERYGSQGWKRTSITRAPTTPTHHFAGPAPSHELERERTGRQIGQVRADYFKSGAGASRSYARAPSSGRPGFGGGHGSGHSGVHH